MKRMTMVAMAVATFAMTQVAFASEDEENEGEERGEYSQSIGSELTGAITRLKGHELYLETEKKERVEIYFNDSTAVVEKGQPSKISALKKGQKVKVELRASDKKVAKIEIL